ncbi:MAG TPA: diguanylate cyclase [Petrotogaceae bacterium]|nr:diguanylate cyclase [Petrotogaceae bacterium]
MNQYDIKMRLYRSILFVGALLSVICIIGNYLSSFPFWPNLKWIVLFLTTVTSYLFSKSKNYNKVFMFGFFFFLIWIFFPFAFLDSGGSNNNAIGYAFLLLITVTYLFGGWKRFFLIFSLIGIFMILHAVEFYFPHLITAYPANAQFTDRMIQIPLLLFASFMIILRFAREYEAVNIKLDDYAKFDELTGLYNRRMFNGEMEEAMRNKKEEIFLVLLDLDNFKKVNDRCGHIIGDEVLKKLADFLRKFLGQGRNIVSRWGGDEFAVIYYGTRIALFEKLECLKKEFKEYVSFYEKTTGISASIIELALYENVSQILIAADQELYKEKARNGK